MVLDTVLILLVMDMDILDTLLLAMAMGTVLPMPGMVMDLDIVHTPLDMVMDTVMDMDMVTDMDTMVRMFGNTNQELKTGCTFIPSSP